MTNQLFSTIIYHTSRVWNGVLRRCRKYVYQQINIGCCHAHNVKFNPHKIHFYGKADLQFHPGSEVVIGDDFICRSGRIGSSIDNHTMSVIEVLPHAKLTIGHHTGISNTCIHCHQSVSIGNYVNVGAGTMIIDTDFHSLDWRDRESGTDIIHRKCKPVVIGSHVFIGANCLILKGVTIGQRCIIGAGSVVCNDIPDDEIWAGNPAVFIKKTEEKE